jgi:trimeric autotransporter adhesin
MSIFERLSFGTYGNSCTFSLFSVTTGNFNTAVGAGSLDLNRADSNTATGAVALLFNTFGKENTAIGAAALKFNVPMKS